MHDDPPADDEPETSAWFEQALSLGWRREQLEQIAHSMRVPYYEVLDWRTNKKGEFRSVREVFRLLEDVRVFDAVLVGRHPGTGVRIVWYRQNDPDVPPEAQWYRRLGFENTMQAANQVLGDIDEVREGDYARRARQGAEESMSDGA